MGGIFSAYSPFYMVVQEKCAVSEGGSCVRHTGQSGDHSAALGAASLGDDEVSWTVVTGCGSPSAYGVLHIADPASNEARERKKESGCFPHVGRSGMYGWCEGYTWLDGKPSDSRTYPRYGQNVIVNGDTLEFTLSSAGPDGMRSLRMVLSGPKVEAEWRGKKELVRGAIKDLAFELSLPAGGDVLVFVGMHGGAYERPGVNNNNSKNGSNNNNNKNIFKWEGDSVRIIGQGLAAKNSAWGSPCSSRGRC